MTSQLSAAARRDSSVRQSFSALQAAWPHAKAIAHSAGLLIESAAFGSTLRIAFRRPGDAHPIAAWFSGSGRLSLPDGSIAYLSDLTTVAKIVAGIARAEGGAK